MMFRILTLSVFLVFGGLKIAQTEIPPAPIQPRCLITGRPQKWIILSKLSHYKDNNNSNDNNNITYKAHYCHPSSKTRFCRKHEFYKTVCTFNKTNIIKGTFFQCNMTKVVWGLYPNLLNLSLPRNARGNTLCTIISATNKNGTSYSKKKCCSVRKDSICTGISNLQGQASTKRELNITWEAPADVSDEWNELLGYQIRYTGNSQTKTIPYSSFTDQLRRPSRQHSVIIKNLPPYTMFFLEISCYFVSPSGNFDSRVYARTLPEAPYSPPTITGVQKVSSNNTMKAVQLTWKHPPKDKWNGVILKSVVSYRMRRNASSSMPVNTTVVHLAVHGQTSETTIKGLDVNYDYGVTVMSCTVECSNESAEYQIKREPRPLPSPQASTESSSSDVIVTVVSVIGGAILVVIVFVGCYRIYQHKQKRKYRVPREPLPKTEDIQVSDITPDSDVSDHAESSDYARPLTILTSLESPNHERASMVQNENDGPIHERASMLQNENDEDDSEKVIPSMEEIPLC